MVAINTLRKNDLNRLGFVGKVVDMKKELSKIVKNQKIRLRGTDLETLNKKVMTGARISRIILGAT